MTPTAAMQQTQPQRDTHYSHATTAPVTQNVAMQQPQPQHNMAQ